MSIVGLIVEKLFLSKIQINKNIIVTLVDIIKSQEDVKCTLLSQWTCVLQNLVADDFEMGQFKTGKFFRFSHSERKLW